ncbi:MAG: T9SS type A sorting domain-containing protein [Saprospiraceae bacterium]
MIQTNYYRLRQVDIDGSFEYSPIRSVRLISDLGTATLQPNPASAQTLLKINSGQSKRLDLQLLHPNGQVLRQHSIDLNAGINHIPLSLENVPTGIYLLQLKSDSDIRLLKGVKTD